MGKIGIIYNPTAGDNKHNPAQRRIALQKMLGHHGVIRETYCVEDIVQVAREFRDMDIKILGISGGDGTNQYVMTSVYQVYGGENLPKIVLLRGGTMNLRETSLKMKGTPEIRLKKLLKMIDEGGELPTISHTLLCVNGKYGCIFGNGLIANFMEEYYRGGNAGFSKAAKLLFKTVCSGLTTGNFISRLFRPIKATVEIEGHILPQRSFAALMAATMRECGLGFKPFYRAREKEGHLHFLAVNLAPMEVISNLPKIHAGKKIHSDNIHDCVVKNVVIETEEPYYYTLDGEMLNSTKRLEVSAGPTVQLVAI